MSSTDRQNRLLVSQDWKRIYQSFRNAEFQSYDFDNLRRAMINYLRENYPEDFNDYIESSEYLALIDMIAFLGQNIAFRIDLNARENYLELAERRESILRLARLLSYNPKRNQAANGLLKVDSVSTTESILDSNNLNLAGQNINWNDPANSNWNEQFQRVLNAALPENAKLGNPVKRKDIAGVPTEQYRLNSATNTTPVFGFNKTVDGRTVPFEIVSTDITDQEVIEEAPLPGNSLAFLFRDDGQGPASTNTGYFCHFRQGTLDTGDFSVTNPSTNQTVSIDAKNINNSDVWLYSLDSVGNERTIWSQVEAIEGNNVIYNSLARREKNIYSVLTRIEDRISLIFADGTFGNLPQGAFRVFYRTSANQQLVINPDSMRAVSIIIPYTSRRGSTERITISLSLKTTVDNASVSETNESIKANAPATYYTQNRMVTGEDYQIAPLSVSQEIVKAKSVNRTSSGISRYFDLIDATGKYSNTNLFGTDGAVYKDFLNPKIGFTFENLTDIEGEVINSIEPILGNYRLRNYYLDQFPKLLVEDLGSVWQQTTADTNQTTGSFQNPNGLSVKVSSFTDSNMKFVKLNSLLKFEPPEGFHFMPDGTLMAGPAGHPGSREYIWSKVVSIQGDGTGETENNTGPIVLNDIVPTGARLVEIRTALPSALTNEVEAQTIDQIFSFRTFGLRYDQNTGEWRIITQNNLDVNAEFSTGKTGDSTGQNLDASWLLLFETDGERYTVTSRGLRYIFESDKEIRFYYDSTDKVFTDKTGKTVKDKISVLSINTQPDSNLPFRDTFDWEIVAEYRDTQGYVDSKKVEVAFFDSDDDGIADDPQIFDEIVDENTNPAEKLIFLQLRTSLNGVNDYVYVTPEEIGVQIFTRKSQVGPLSQYEDQSLFYFLEEDVFEILNRDIARFSISSNYRAQVGRDNLKFRYFHAADQNARIDPSASNIIDTYLLTRGYDTAFRQFLSGATSEKPLPPSSDSLFLSYGQQLNQIKSVSDEIIYQPVKYKVLFGSKADEELQARFKIVKNPDLVINDNELKSRVIRSINRYFSLDNWDFGDTFYFSELASYVMLQLTPDLATFVIVPEQVNQTFGSLFEIKTESDEILISGATVADIDIIDEITASRLQAGGAIVRQTTSVNAGIMSSTSNLTSTAAAPSTGSAQTTTSTPTTPTTPSIPPSSGGGGGYSY